MTTLQVSIDKPGEMNFILGHAHFIKTVEDLYEAIVQTAPAMKFGLSVCEASGPALIRLAGNDERLTDLARRNALAVGAGHSFDAIEGTTTTSMSFEPPPHADIARAATTHATHANRRDITPEPCSPSRTRPRGIRRDPRRRRGRPRDRTASSSSARSR